MAKTVERLPNFYFYNVSIGRYGNPIWNIMKFLNATLVFLFVLAASPACAAAIASPEMKKAVHALVLSQDLKTNWPLIMRNMGLDAATQVARGAMDKLKAREDLTPAERERVGLAVKGIAGKIAAELDQMNKQTDVDQLVEDMALAVYPKYFTLAEIQKMTAFYNTSAFKKLVQAELAITAESKRGGSDVAKIRERIYATIPERESRVFLAFASSELGRKQQRLSNQVTADGVAYLQNRHRPALEAIVARNTPLLREQLRDLQK
jgi:hypothetical protein